MKVAQKLNKMNGKNWKLKKIWEFKKDSDNIFLIKTIIFIMIRYFNL